MAYLAGGEPFVYFDEMFPSVGQFVFQQSKKQTIAIIHSGFTVTKTLVRHCLHIQTFHTNNIILIGYLSGYFM